MGVGFLPHSYGLASQQQIWPWRCGGVRVCLALPGPAQMETLVPGLCQGHCHPGPLGICLQDSGGPTGLWTHLLPPTALSQASLTTPPPTPHLPGPQTVSWPSISGKVLPLLFLGSALNLGEGRGQRRWGLRKCVLSRGPPPLPISSLSPHPIL